jgi:hypothetical protein
VTVEDLFDPSPEGADAPRPGLFQLYRRGRPEQPVKIWFGPPLDPLTRQPLERSHRWNMLLNDEPVSADPTFREPEGDPYAPWWGDVWPQCSGSPIAPGHYAYLVASIRHARQHDPEHPFARPDRKIDLRTAPLPFG